MIAEVFNPDIAPDPLTPREREVVELIAKGMRQKDIATALCLTSKYVYELTRKARTKYCVDNTYQLLVRYRETPLSQ